MALTWKDGSVTHVGQVLGFETSVERIMSDVYADVRYAVVLVDGKISRVATGCSEFGSNVTNAVIDADINVITVTLDVMKAEEVAREQNARAHVVNDMVRRAQTPDKGKTVVVARGRKVAKGTEGRVFWFGNNGFGDSVGIECADGAKHFTAAKNVDVVNPDEYLDMDECLKPVNVDYAAKVAAKRLFALTGYSAA